VTLTYIVERGNNARRGIIVGNQGDDVGVEGEGPESGDLVVECQHCLLGFLGVCEKTIWVTRGLKVGGAGGGLTLDLLHGHNILLGAAPQDRIDNKALKENAVTTPVDDPANADLRGQVSQEQETREGLLHGRVHEGTTLHLEVAHGIVWKARRGR